MSYTLKPDQVFAGHQELYENDAPKLCPYQAPFMVTTKLNPNPTPMYKGCGTWCALFKHHKSGSEETVFILCSPTPNQINIHSGGRKPLQAL